MPSFFLQYLRHPKSVGAIMPSGRRLAQKMMEPIDFSSAKCIVEFGPGTGAFTKELLKRRRKTTVLLLIEQNEAFYRLLKEKYGSLENVFLVHGSAEDADAILREHGFRHAEYIVSGLPFTSLPREVSLRTFRAARRIIGRDGKFITFQYTTIKKKFFEKYFRFHDCLFELRNVPPAYVFVLKNKRRPAK